MSVPATLTDVRDPHAGVSYPNHLLEGCDTALLLFCAHWHGKQDAYWIADAGLTATCVDLDVERLGDMRAIYPFGWAYYDEDVFTWAETAVAGGCQWDVVSLDPWTNQFDECAAHIALWCSLAHRLVVLGTGHDTKVIPADGWQITEVAKRSDHAGGVYWTCLEPA